MGKKNSLHLQLESLEDRLTPAFDLIFNPAIDTWTINQVLDEGAATISIDGVDGLTIMDSSGAATIGVPSSNMTIRMLNNSQDDLTVNLDVPLSGDLTIFLGQGGRTATFTGASLNIGGNLRVMGGSSDETLTLSVPGVPLTVGGSVDLDMGIGDDTIATDADPASGLIVGGNLNLRGVNFFESRSQFIIGGSVYVNSSNENVGSIFDLDLPGNVIGGNFTYIGGTAFDYVFLNDDTGPVDGGTTIGGNVMVNLGTGLDPTGLNDQILELQEATVGGNVTLITGLSSLRSQFVSSDSTVIGGNIFIDFGLNLNVNPMFMHNEVTLLGQFGGSAITYRGHSGTDTISYGMIGNRARIFATLGLGADSFTLDTLASGTSVGFLYIDFGFDTDTWTNNFGAPFSFPTILRNLP